MKNIMAGILSIAVIFSINVTSFAEDITQSTASTEKSETQVTTVLEENIATPYAENPNLNNYYSYNEPAYTNVPVLDDMQGFNGVTEKVNVENIVVSEFKDKMNVEETQNISATVIPATATNSTLTYSSSDSRIATVDELGKLTAIRKGTCTISVEADGYVTYLSLTVKVKTAKIEIEKSFVTLKLEQTYSLNAKVIPAEAPQTLKYKSTDESIVTVSPDGTVSAKGIGNATVIISNDDTTISLNVIVNSANAQENIAAVQGADDSGDKLTDELADKIRNSNEKTVVADGNKVKIISKSVLRELYGTDKRLVIECEDYSIVLNGKDINNIENELNTYIKFESKQNGISVVANNGKNLPGKIKIEFEETFGEFNYMYIYNTAKEEYEVINISLSGNAIELDSTGLYLLTIDKLHKFSINIIIVCVAVGIILILSGVYIFVKKKYWFW